MRDICKEEIEAMNVKKIEKRRRNSAQFSLSGYSRTTTQ